MRAGLVTLLASLAASGVSGNGVNHNVNQLTADDIGDFSAADFAHDRDRHSSHKSKCKAFPGSDDWPTDAEWQRLNETVGGVLLKPLPPAVVCYQGPHYDADACTELVEVAPRTHFYLEDPVTILSPWFQGSTCMPVINATGTCTQGGFPVYVVNATKPKHVQAAVNFARNKNIRLIIKNTGHDFGGRSAGAGSLSVWTHHMKEFEFIPEYKKGQYSGMAVRYGAGLEAWEAFTNAAKNNITVVAPGGRTVGANGGWFALGGHGSVTSYFGLGSDQALEISVVTADGRFVTASPYENEDLFFAMRGGGGSTYGIVTSVLAKAHPPVNLIRVGLDWVFDNSEESLPDLETFWRGVYVYFRFTKTIVDAGGVDWNYIRPLGNNTYSFMTGCTLVNKTADEAAKIFQPLYDDLNKAGINITMPPLDPNPYANEEEAPAEPLANTRYRSRLWPYKNWEDDELYIKSMDAIRQTIEDGFTFHGLGMHPTHAVAGWPGSNSAVNPAWRVSVMHACMMSTQPTSYTAQDARDEEARVQKAMKLWRDASPGAGSYMNEGDPGEPEWQQAFYGHNYDKLLKIKRERDPWGVFWAATTVGSEEWEVKTVDGYPRSQNGRLCKAGS